MHSSKSVLSDNYFFVVGIYALLTPALIDGYYHIIDIDAGNYSKMNLKPVEGKHTVVFISNDLEYYSLRSIENISFIDKRSKVSEILLFMLMNDSQCKYQIKHQLSSREREILSCIQEGMAIPAIAEKLGVKEKTFYAHRRNIMLKFGINNRISLYYKIFTRDKSKQKDDFLHRSI